MCLDDELNCEPIQIPKGEKGDKGDVGPEGPQGPQGLSAPNAWNLDGNSELVERYFGTNNNFDLPIKTNGIETIRFFKSGQIGIGTNVFDTNFKVTQLGNLRVKNSIPGVDGLIEGYSTLNGSSGVVRAIHQNNNSAEIRADYNYAYADLRSTNAAYYNIYLGGNLTTQVSSANSVQQFYKFANTLEFQNLNNVGTAIYIGTDNNVGLGGFSAYTGYGSVDAKLHILGLLSNPTGYTFKTSYWNGTSKVDSFAVRNDGKVFINQSISNITDARLQVSGSKNEHGISYYTNGLDDNYVGFGVFNQVINNWSYVIQKGGGIRQLGVQDNWFGTSGNTTFSSIGVSANSKVNCFHSGQHGFVSLVDGTDNIYAGLGILNGVNWRFRVNKDGLIIAPYMPTSSVGLPTGALWNDAGTVKIVYK